MCDKPDVPDQVMTVAELEAKAARCRVDVVYVRGVRPLSTDRVRLVEGTEIYREPDGEYLGCCEVWGW